MNWSVLRRAFARFIGQQPKTWLPQLAKITAVHTAAGSASGLARPHAVDVQLLGVDGADDLAVPVLERVELPAPGLGPGAAVWAVPDVGTRVRVGFYGGLIHRPYVDQVLQFGHEVPERRAGEMVVDMGDLQVGLTRDGVVVVLAADSVVVARDKSGDLDKVMLHSAASSDLDQVQAQVNALRDQTNSALATIDGKVALIPIGTGAPAGPSGYTPTSASLSLSKGQASAHVYLEASS